MYTLLISFVLVEDRCSHIVYSSVKRKLMLLGMAIGVKVISVFIQVISPPPFPCPLSVRNAVYPSMLGVLEVCRNLVSCTVAMSMCSLLSSSVSSSIYELSPFILICRILRFFLGLCLWALCRLGQLAHVHCLSQSRRVVSVHLRWSQWLVLLHWMEVCLVVIYLVQMLHVQVRVGGPGFVSTSPVSFSSSTSHVKGTGKLAQKTVRKAPLQGAGKS